jgi:cyclase
VKIFNELEVDELVLLDITATVERRGPRFELIEEIASECFMPLAYGGGVTRLDDIKRLFGIGMEKVVISSAAVADPQFISDAVEQFGSQSIVVCIDVKRDIFGRARLYTHSATKPAKLNPVEHAQKMVELGAGELIVNSIDRDGTMVGYDLELLKAVASAVPVPVVACGGAGNLGHFGEAMRVGRTAAVAAGSLFVFRGKHRAVLINYPARSELAEVLSDIKAA